MEIFISSKVVKGTVNDIVEAVEEVKSVLTRSEYGNSDSTNLTCLET